MAIELRGHHFLCIPRFRGYGYSKQFTQTMAATADALSRRPDTLITAVSKPDLLCRACPNLTPPRTCKDPENEINIRYMDRLVIAQLNIKPGEAIYWDKAQSILAAVGGKWRQTICSDCQWSNLCK